MSEDAALEDCKFRLAYRYHEVDILIKRLREERKTPKSYAAAKGLSQDGLYYVIVANFDSHSTLYAYRTLSTVRTKSLSAASGEKFVSRALDQVSEAKKSVNEGAAFHERCDFVRVSTSVGDVEGEYLNASIQDESSPLGSILQDFAQFRESIYADVDWSSVAPALPPDVDAGTIASLQSKLKENTFFELATLWRIQETE